MFALGETICHPLSVLSLAVAFVVGLALFPVILVFSPIYFPWTLLVLAVGGALVGLTIGSRGRSSFARALGLAAVVILALVMIFRATANSVGPLSVLFWSLGWLLAPVFAGALAGAAARRSLGLTRGAGVIVLGTAALAGLGAALAITLAPSDVADIPYCEGSPACPRITCWTTAERRRLLAIESITAYDGQRIDCTYTAWGGIRIGTVSGTSGHGSGWTDADWPLLLSARGR